eukprot:763540-Hanusia_phi.AAC.2
MRQVGVRMMSIPASRCISLTQMATIKSANARNSWEHMRALCSQQGEFVDLDGLSLPSAASLINKKILHVLIDVQGWNDGRSISLLSTRPAPVQVRLVAGGSPRFDSCLLYQISFKNFVGTLGSHDVVPWIIT